MGGCLSGTLADLILVETTTVDEIVTEVAVPDVQCLGLCAPGVWCELIVKAVGKLGLEDSPVREGAHELGFRPVPFVFCLSSFVSLLRDSVRTLQTIPTKHS